MSIRTPSLPAVFALVLLSACSDSKTIKNLEVRVSELENASASTKETLEALQRKVEVGEIIQNLDENAYLQPSDQGYSTIRSDLGFMTIRLTDVKPYATGSRVVLEFGNISAAAINGVKAKVDWGRVDDKGLPISDNERPG